MQSFIHKLEMNRKRTLLVAGVTVAILGAIILYYTTWLSGLIKNRSEQIAADARVEVEESRLRPASSDGITVYLNASDARATATLKGTRYLATGGGLIAVNPDGSVKRRYTSLDGLPDNDLTALAVFRDRLFIGTASRGLLGFDGDTFTSYSFVKPKAARVSVLIETESELLIGTLDGGLFEFDGERFTRRFNSAAGASFSRVTALLPLESRLYIGTQDQGLYLWREAQIEHIGTNEGLPSPRVTGLAALPPPLSDAGRIAVATDFGVVGLADSNELKPIANQPNITSLAVVGGQLWAGLFSGGVAQIGSDRATQRATPDNEGQPSAAVAGLPQSAPAIVHASDGKFWALTREGAFVRSEREAGPGFEAIAGALVAGRMLTGDHITGLALDGGGRLWVGYFDRGIDIIAPESSERLSHVEDDRVREVNFVAYDRNDDQVLAATSRGLVLFDSRLKQTILTRQQDGLINDSIAHVSLRPKGAFANEADAGSSNGHAVVLATAGGLTEFSRGRARSLTAFHGLASNHLYSSVVVGSRLFVGSLSGLVELENLRVVRTYRTANSPLAHDWVTALAEADGTLYIGTNGGGVDALLPTGEWVSFAGEVGKFEVNQNAMHYDGERLYVGTSDRGVLIYNTRARRWSRINSGFTSQNVTAIASDDQFIYIGTMNGLVRLEKRILS